MGKAKETEAEDIGATEHKFTEQVQKCLYISVSFSLCELPLLFAAIFAQPPTE